MKLLISVILVGIMAGCSFLNFDSGETPGNDEGGILQFTEEQVVEDGNDKYIVVYYPLSVEEPVVFKNEETGQWATAARITLGD